MTLGCGGLACENAHGKMRNAPSGAWEREALTLKSVTKLGTSRFAHGARAAVHGDRKFITALARGLEVLRVFTPTEGLLGNGEIAERTRLPKPTVSRLTYTLTKLGYLSHIERLAEYPTNTRRRFHSAIRRSPTSASASSPAPTCRRWRTTPAPSSRSALATGST